MISEYANSLGDEDIPARGDSDEPDAVRPTLKSSEEAPEVEGGVRDRRGPGLRTGLAAGRRRSEHGRMRLLWIEEAQTRSEYVTTVLNQSVRC